MSGLHLLKLKSSKSICILGENLFSAQSKDIKDMQNNADQSSGLLKLYSVLIRNADTGITLILEYNDNANNANNHIMYSEMSLERYLREYRVLRVAEFISEPTNRTVLEFADYWNKAGPRYHVNERNCQHMAKCFMMLYCGVEDLKTQTDWISITGLTLGLIAVMISLKSLNK